MCLDLSTDRLVTKKYSLVILNCALCINFVGFFLFLSNNDILFGEFGQFERSCGVAHIRISQFHPIGQRDHIRFVTGANFGKSFTFFSLPLFVIRLFETKKTHERFVKLGISKRVNNRIDDCIATSHKHENINRQIVIFLRRISQKVDDKRKPT
jgi:hypothetical protein